MFYARDVLFFAIVISVLGALGFRVRRARPGLSKLEALALTCGFVLGICELLTWLSGILLGVGFASICCFLLPCAGVWWFSRNTKRLKSDAAREAETVDRARVGSLEEKLLALYLGAVLVLTFVCTLAPPSGADYDSLVYHLAAPAQYLRHGRIVPLPYDHHSYFPLGTEMLFLLGLEFGGPVLAKLFHWLMLPLCCAAIVAIAQRHFSRRAGLLGASLFASLPLVQSEATTAYIDLALVAFSLLAALCFLRWTEFSPNASTPNMQTPNASTSISSTRNEASSEKDGFGARWLWLCGAFCGVCLGTKYFGILTLFWLIAAIFALMIKRRRFAPKALFSFVAIAILVGGGWYLRNVLWTGNPVFPFAYDVFGGRGWSPERATAYAADVGAFGFGKSPADLVLLPWRLSMTPLGAGQPFWPLSTAFIEKNAANHEGLFEVRGLLLTSILGPALFAFGAPTIFLRRKPRAVRFAGWSVLFFGVVWAFSSQTIRYLMPAYALACVACGFGLEVFSARSAILKWTSRLALAAWLLWTPALFLHQNSATFPVVFGAQTPEEYSKARFAGFDAMNWASQNTPRDARFAVYGEPRTFPLDRDYFWADSEHNMLIDYSKLRDGAALVAALRERGATYVLWNTIPARNGGFGTAPPQLQDAINRGILRQIYAARGYVVLQIAPK